MVILQMGEIAKSTSKDGIKVKNAYKEQLLTFA